ncbi:hypothetical protein SEA_ANNADREAMY_124 [Streptomyces phage Annadreamy]|uniref:Uncharacterized protein n=1 Tax=Streptomyces phage Annadreamy TaxID=2250335 RepID=A0A345GTE9_9CAUD|nr:hypothetical protein HWB75_gp142 [Streptomyces phage Annadreamy]AXG66221.1 hypothetical protein SEA_ANNADREAMY_124 [Streptomyces phage Annadreamy]
MATGKERGFKDWHGSKEFRRSARNYTESDTINRGRKKKNTKKWCKGVVGRKHTLALFNKYSFSRNYKCIKCGKEIWHISNREDYNYEEKSPMEWADYQ